jgi:hypothetical protein
MAAVLQQLAPLKALGWEFDERYGYYRYPLTEPWKRWPNSPLEPLGWLVLNVNKRSTKVSLTTSVYNDVKIPAYLAEHQAALAHIAAPARCSLSGIWPVLLELSGGSADTVDWSGRVAEVNRRVAAWCAELRRLFDMAIAIAKERRDNWSPVVASLTITIGSDGEVSASEDGPLKRPSSPAPSPESSYPRC